MAWYPSAKRMEVQPEGNAQPSIRPTQMIFHSLAAPWTGRRTYEYWRDSTSLESHFYVEFGGSVFQYIGTQTRADANMYANRRPDGSGAVSVETASNLQHTDRWTPSQVSTLIKLGAWMHKQHGVPLRICRSASDPGFGTHRMFAQWSNGGTACPGNERQRQFREVVFPGIVKAAGGKPPKPEKYEPFPGADFFRNTPRSALITAMGKRLVAEGCSAYSEGPGPRWTDADKRSYAKWQRKLGYSGADADGWPGKTSWDKLKVPKV
ncbi:peptidoglycan-binding protein [Streptomyces spectabilis]|uniref:peptidoglycan-binding protein n=1 Tax=Streptomyces spectabilis TaxID=68270 RepID=UPI001CEF7F05|nr:peptidoglycan-binding protein [Streptomyces spectabilis]